MLTLINGLINVFRNEKITKKEGSKMNTETMTAEQQEKIIQYKHVAQWFLLAFNKLAINDYGYFCQWCNRYDRGIDFFVAQMDSKRREAWLEYFQE